MTEDYDYGLTASQQKCLMPIAAAVPLLRGKGGRPPYLNTVRKWADPKHGYRRLGQVIVLKTIRVSGCLLTLEEWIEMFERERSKLGSRKQETPRERPRRQAAAAQRRAKEWLDGTGQVTSSGGFWRLATRSSYCSGSRTGPSAPDY